MPRKTHKDDIREDLHEAGDQLEAIAENAGRYARKVLNETQNVGEHIDAFADVIREEPIKAALIALGVGALIGMLIKK